MSTSDFNFETDFIFDEFEIASVNEIFIQSHSTEILSTDVPGFYDIHAKVLEIDAGSFSGFSTILTNPVWAIQKEGTLLLSCSCKSEKSKLCEHQAQVLYNILKREEFRIFFDEALRLKKIQQVAGSYGMQDEPDLNSFFTVEYLNKKPVVKARNPQIMPVTEETTIKFREQLMLSNENLIPQKTKSSETTGMFVVLKQHKYYKHLLVELYEGPFTQTGKVKNPITVLDPLDLVWKTNETTHIKFFTGIFKFQNGYSTTVSESDIDGLKAIIKNPLSIPFYYHSKTSENVVAGSITPVSLASVVKELNIEVEKQGHFYTIAAKITINKELYELRDLTILFDFFILLDDKMFLIGNVQLLKVIEFFKMNKYSLMIHESKYPEFQQNILSKLEEKIKVSLPVPIATNEQMQIKGFNKPAEKIMYLSELGNYVNINPVMKYGEVEIPVLSKKEIYAVDQKGKTFTVKRDYEAEDGFIALLLQQHPDFEEQLENSLLYFYLHKNRFLDEDWFLKAFEDWENQDISILGFNELSGNKLNPHKAKISVKVTSGINWFNTDIQVKFGKKKASLKQLHRAVINKSKFIKLDDGTKGILPAEWLEKFASFFNSGEIVDDTIRTTKQNYDTISELYSDEEIDETVVQELALLKNKFSDFEAIEEVAVPADLKGTLRDYQKQGLNWLNFLDDFDFGGCLADDMGLGKSIQIIAFILTQRKKNKTNTNLLVVPTSLIFNWQAEIAKFAPSLKILTAYGAERKKDISSFDHYEVVLTTYGTLISDVVFLKKYTFNYIFLDESQNIKNIDSQRYKAVRLLNARNRIAITGTPIENNTFDLYAQLSFTCPGLLGSRQYFKDIYSLPIDKFKETRRAKELQQKINPFILRRTKKEVAKELPDKTEMVVYCEMGKEQRQVYDAYEKEFREFISAKTNEEIPKNSMNVLRGLTRLRQICNSPKLLSDEKLYEDSSSKIDAIVEQIENKSSRHKILIFSQFVSMLDLIKLELQARSIRFEYLTGATKNRASVVNSFQDNVETRIMLISLKAGGTGLNLTEADYVFLVDPWWNPAVENQAIDRCYRIGQKKNVVAIRLICPGTVEEKIMKLQESKKELADGLIQTEGSILKSLGKTDLLKLLG